MNKEQRGGKETKESEGFETEKKGLGQREKRVSPEITRKKVLFRNKQKGVKDGAGQKIIKLRWKVLNPATR